MNERNQKIEKILTMEWIWHAIRRKQEQGRLKLFFLLMQQNGHTNKLSVKGKILYTIPNHACSHPNMEECRLTRPINTKSHGCDLIRPK